jgi:hypothetical protein
MKIFYQLALGRAAKTDAVVELRLGEIIGLLVGREIRFETQHDSIVLRSYMDFSRSAPRTDAKA